MNLKRLGYTTAAVFLFALLWNGVVHLLVLRQAEAAIAGVVRVAAQQSLLLALLQTAAVAFLFVITYARCARHPGVRGGLAHGALFGLLAGLLVDLNQFILYPIPGSLAVAWFASGFAEFCLYGVLTAWLYPVAASSDGVSGA